MTALREEYPHTSVETLCNPWPRLVSEVLFREELPSAPQQADTHDQLQPRLPQTDAFSHAVIGWCLTETLEADGTVRALEMAIETAGGGNLCATIHHSDRGSQPT